MPNTVENKKYKWRDIHTDHISWDTFNKEHKSWRQWWENHQGGGEIGYADQHALNAIAGQMYLLQIDCSEIPQFSGALTVIYDDTILKYKDFCGFTALGVPTGKTQRKIPNMVSNNGGELVLNWNQPQNKQYSAMVATIAFEAVSTATTEIKLK